jgi:hypothetical protein
METTEDAVSRRCGPFFYLCGAAELCIFSLGVVLETSKGLLRWKVQHGITRALQRPLIYILSSTWSVYQNSYQLGITAAGHGRVYMVGMRKME